MSLSDWLREVWEPDEVLHGRALRAYVRAAWPDFDWDAAYAPYLAEYRVAEGRLGPTKALEMAARCALEANVNCFYRAVSKIAGEPVLSRLFDALSGDEVRHYKEFHARFLSYRETEPPSRLRLLAKLVSRAKEADDRDAGIAFRHIWRARNPGLPFEESKYTDFKEEIRRRVHPAYDYANASKMLLKPLALPPGVNRRAVQAVGWILRMIVRPSIRRRPA